jgi:hypothetical protein
VDRLSENESQGCSLNTNRRIEGTRPAQAVLNLVTGLEERSNVDDYDDYDE